LRTELTQAVFNFIISPISERHRSGVKHCSLFLRARCSSLSVT